MTVHKSVGAIIRDKEGRILMMDRKNIPYGWACPAGHIDEGETPEQALERETEEETGFHLSGYHLLIHEFVPWNDCKKGGKGHDWYVFEVETYEGTLRENAESKGMRWVDEKELSQLELEKVWRYWFGKLGIG